MKLFKSIPVLPATNMRETIDFYETRLGFKGVNYGNYAIIKAGNAEIHFMLVTDKNKLQPANCYILTDDPKDLYIKMAERDLLYFPLKTDYINLKEKEFCIIDNNRNIIRFGEQKPGII